MKKDKFNSILEFIKPDLSYKNRFMQPAFHNRAVESVLDILDKILPARLVFASILAGIILYYILFFILIVDGYILNSSVLLLFIVMSLIILSVIRFIKNKIK